ncbi:MAG: Uma2 family endonuclease [Polyangiales bacterium]
MAHGAARQMHWSEREYLQMEDRSAIKHEYLDGEVFAMAGAKPEHNDIAAALTVALGVMVRGRGCRAFNSDQRIHVPATGLYTYPDGGIKCGGGRIHADGMSLLDPVLLFEVLSESTRDYDRGAKLDHYKGIPTLRHVLLVDSAARHIEHHHRSAGGEWELATHLDGSIDLHDLGGLVALDEIYLTDAR